MVARPAAVSFLGTEKLERLLERFDPFLGLVERLSSVGDFDMGGEGYGVECAEQSDLG